MPAIAGAVVHLGLECFSNLRSTRRVEMTQLAGSVITAIRNGITADAGLTADKNCLLFGLA
jgi:hypothetical protein